MTRDTRYAINPLCSGERAMDMPREVLRAMRDARKTRKAELRRAGLMAPSRPSKAERAAREAEKRERIETQNADLGKRYDSRDRDYCAPWDGRAPKSETTTLHLAAYKSASRIHAGNKPRLHGGKWDYVAK
jgi:hypothetical protein